MPYVPSPLLVDGMIYTLKVNAGTLSVSTPDRQGALRGERLPGVSKFTPPRGARERIYVLGRDSTAWC
jgi:hypothetical protein